jgi:hypothetical protein
MAAPGGPRVRLRLTLLPARLVDRMAAVLAPLAAWPALLLAATWGLAAYRDGFARLAAGGPVRPAGAPEWAAGLGLFLLTAIWHELGHAAALRREGLPVGRVGAGVLLVVPVLFCDVSPVALLRRAGRLRVDLAGMAFQAAAGGTLFACGARETWAPARVAGLSALAAVLWSLLPFVRADGYWLLCDLLDRRDLETPVVWTFPDASGGPPPVRAGRRRLLATFLAGYRLAHAAFLLLVATGLPYRLVTRLPLLEWWMSGGARRWLAAACGLLLLGGTACLGLAVGRRIRGLLAAAGADLRAPQRAAASPGRGPPTTSPP